MATTVLLSDFTTNKHFHLVFTEVEFATIEANWEKEDKLLVEVSSTSTTSFKGRTRWCDLTPFHYQVLLTQNLAMLVDLTDDEQMDESNEVVKSLHFLITGLIKALENGTNSNVELLRIDRVNDETINFSFHGSQCLNLAVTKKDKKKTDSFKIVVDNTKKSD